MISMTGVYKTFSNSLTQSVLENINLRIGKGEFVYVIGDSGAGKTTMLRMLIGDEAPSRGQIEVMGQDMSQGSLDGVQGVRRRMGAIFQDLRLIEDMSVIDNICLALETGQESLPQRLKDRSLWNQEIEALLHHLGLTTLRKKSVQDLSGGERQRVAAARCLIRQPEILVADEPTGALDHEHTWALMELIQKLHMKGTTVLLATHDREIVRKIRRRSCVLRRGKLVIEEGLCAF